MRRARESALILTQHLWRHSVTGQAPVKWHFQYSFMFMQVNLYDGHSSKSEPDLSQAFHKTSEGHLIAVNDSL